MIASATFLPDPPAAQATPGSCTTTRGVVVVVDFTHFGGGVQRGCAPSAPTSGLLALEAAGFSLAGTERYGYAFLCRIDGQPAQQTCVNTPPADAYWEYWSANPGAPAWTASSVGASSSTQVAGSIEAWAFGASAAPSVSPAAMRATDPVVVTGTPSPRSGTPAPAPVTSSAPRSSPAPATRSTSPTRSTVPNRPTSPNRSTSPTRAAATAPVPSSPAPASPSPATPPPSGSLVGEVSPASRSGTGGASIVPLLIGVGLVVLLGGVAAGVARARGRP